jgi:hypothetical protein
VRLGGIVVLFEQHRGEAVGIGGAAEAVERDLYHLRIICHGYRRAERNDRLRTAPTAGPTPGLQAAHDKYYALIFEQYKTYLELAEKADTRAATLDTFFLPINTAVLAFIAAVWPKADANFIYPSK